MKKKINWKKHILSKRDMKQNKLARWWCQLNAWKIPSELRHNFRKESKDFMRGAFSMLEEVMSAKDHEEATKIWRKGDF